MRGFRGSRAAQSFNSRSERHYERKSERESFLRLVEQRQQPKPQPQLPAWLKGLAAPQPGPQPLAQRERKELPPNVIPITAAKKRVAAKPAKAKAPPKAKAAKSRSVSAKRK